MTAWQAVCTALAATVATGNIAGVFGAIALGSLTVLGTGNATQVNTIAASINSSLTSNGVINESQTGMVALIIGIVDATIDLGLNCSVLIVRNTCKISKRTFC